MSLSAGSIAFTGFNGDGNDNLSFVALTDIPQGTVINFTDSNWDGTSFATGSNAESTIAWTATSAIAAGAVIGINNIGKGTLGASAGIVTFTDANNTGLSNDSEVVYAYVGSSTSPTFLAAISNVGYATSDGTLTGTGLVVGQTAVSFTGGLDIVGYIGQRFGLATFADYLAAIGDTGNWITQNGSGDQSADGHTPDAPFPTTAFTVAPPAAQLISFSPSNVSIAEGDNGTRTMTFTVVRSGCRLRPVLGRAWRHPAHRSGACTAGCACTGAAWLRPGRPRCCSCGIAAPSAPRFSFGTRSRHAGVYRNKYVINMSRYQIINRQCHGPRPAAGELKCPLLLAPSPSPDSTATATTICPLSP